MLKLWKKNKIMFILLVAILFLFPSTINQVSLSESHLIVVGLGIDKQGEEYNVSAQFLIPKQSSSFTPTYKIANGKGENVKQAMDMISLHYGKQIALGHCEYICVNDELCQQSLVEVIDYLYRAKFISNSALVFNTKKSSSTLLKLNEKMQSKYSFNLTSFIQFDNSFVLVNKCNIEKIYKSYFNENDTFLMFNIELKENEDDGIKIEGQSSESSSSDSQLGGGGSEGGSSGGEGGGVSSSEKSEKENVISNAHTLSLFKNSRKVADVNLRDLQGYNLAFGNAEGVRLYIEGVKDEIYDNANVGLGAKVLFSVRTADISENKIVANCFIECQLTITDIEEAGQSSKLYNTNVNLMTENLKNLIKDEIKREIQHSFDVFKQHKCDIYCVSDYIKKYNYQMWKSFYDKGELETILDKVEFDFDIHVSEYI